MIKVKTSLFLKLEMVQMYKWFCHLILCTKLLLISGITEHDKVCFGTYLGLIVETYEPLNLELHYNNLRDRYTGCTYVDGNLEITWIKNNIYDLSFLQDIREVTGYVLISDVEVDDFILPKLQIIRGRKLFQYENMKNDYGLFVFYSEINTLRLPALREIIHGTVGVVDSSIDCYIKTIDWDEIISDPKAITRIENNIFNIHRNCPSCDSTCEKGCWADGPENCQKFNKKSCSPQCLQARCFGQSSNECCHVFCAGGCTGPTQKDCFACRNFNDDGVCKQECPAILIKNPTNDLWEPNPDGKYVYGDICVKKCPELMLEDNSTCVHSCPSNKMEQKGVCVPCVGCLKTCKINQIVHFRTIDIFQGCNIIEGSVDILDPYLSDGRSIFKRCTQSLDLLEKSLSSVKEITGYLSIREFHCLKDLSFLRNLEVIGGKQLDPIRNVSLLIMDTSLESLRLKSLKRIDSGAVAIVDNKDLCYVEDINWNQIQKSQSLHNNITLNRNSTVCELKKQICSEECTTAGCWGFGPDQCLECKNFIYNGSCLATCKSLGKIYQIDKKTCGDCHQECKGLCSGPNADDCDECANVKDGDFCVLKCSVSKYSKDGICLNCHESCYSCTGPENCFQTKSVIYYIIAFIFLLITFLIVIILCYINRQKTKASNRINQILTGTDYSEPLKPSNVGPNLTKLRIIKEAEIHRGGILGMGAFGKVYKGVWIPENENVKIPVAIKVLMNISGSESSKEFLDEAYIMCSVEHPNLLKLHAVCMTSQMMLITQLMPLGCLLDYVRRNKDKIGSKTLLNWSTQIARGMSYLEERRLVHRDLAARNVLVQTPSCVKITDFGLAKLLDYDSDTYQSAGGKMPIKWLALESIRYGIFTSKSDVWSFGITIWELLTYGSIPYENIAAKDVADLIKVGHKLPQPDICSLDIYCVLLSCWVFDADARPTFLQLSETFAEKASDHSRYLDIPGDEFLELPSYTTKDEKKLIRKLATSRRKSIKKTTMNDQVRTNDDDMSEYIELQVRNNQSENINPTKTIPHSGYMNIAEVLIHQPSTSVNNPEYMIINDIVNKHFI